MTGFSRAKISDTRWAPDGKLYFSVLERRVVTYMVPFSTIDDGLSLLTVLNQVNWISALSSLVLIFSGGLLVTTLLTIRRLGRRVVETRKELRALEEERGRAEQAWMASESFYHSLVESLPQNIFRKDSDGRFTFANQRFCETLGRPLADVIGRTDRDFFPAELAEKYRNDDLRVIQDGDSIDEIEDHAMPDGEVRHVQVGKSPLRDAAGQIVGLQGIFWDVTDQRKALTALAASEERFALAIAGTNDGIWDWNVRTNESFVSPRFRQLLGYQETDPDWPNSFARFVALLHPEDRSRTQEALDRHFQERTPFDLEYRILCKSGDYRWFQVRGQALWNEEGVPTRMVGSLTEIQSRKLAEELLREQNHLLQEMARSERMALAEREQAQSRMVESAKLAGLGQLVAGVAHEINNPLAFVGNNVAVLERDLDEIRQLIEIYRSIDRTVELYEPAVAASIQEACVRLDLDYTLSNLPRLLRRTREGLQRIRDIVKDLRVFARLDEDEYTEATLLDGISSSIRIILGYSKKHGVEVIQEHDEIPPVYCNATKINQVVMNLIVNAIDACDRGGKVIVRTLNRRDPDQIVIEVSDNGSGIEPAIRSRIFDPFFTTKPVGVGTGLGLSISYGIVQDHDGTIEVESEIGVGTCFRVILPRGRNHKRHPRIPLGDATTGHEESEEPSPGKLSTSFQSKKQLQQELDLHDRSDVNRESGPVE